MTRSVSNWKLLLLETSSTVNFFSSQDLPQHLAVDIGQSEISPLISVGQFGMIDAQQVQYRRIEIEDADRVASDVIAEIVGLSDRQAGLDASTGEPGGETSRMMITSVIVLCQPAL